MLLPPRVAGFAMLLLCNGCYHATVETGATPSNVVIHKTFASGRFAGWWTSPIQTIVSPWGRTA